MNTLAKLNDKIVSCTRCPRLVKWREEVARTKRRMYLDWDYWGRPVPGFGDPAARVLIIGLAPAAHGANRTGRVFTGDDSGNWLYTALHNQGWANKPISTHRGDGLALTDAYVSAVARCAPPKNRPTPEELSNCAPFLQAELGLLEESGSSYCPRQHRIRPVSPPVEKHGQPCPDPEAPLWPQRPLRPPPSVEAGRLLPPQPTEHPDRHPQPRNA